MTTTTPVRLPAAELRTLFLFDSLTDDQLQWIADRGEVRTYDTGTTVYGEGEDAEFLYVLLSGGLRMSRSVQGEDVTVVESNHRGSYSGAMRAYIAGEDGQRYMNSMVTTEPSRFFLLPSEAFAQLMREWFPMAVHLLDGLFLGIRNSEGAVLQREHLARLGRLSAGLAHELNNPAAAAMRATGQLRDQVSRTRHKLRALAEGKFDASLLAAVVDVQEETIPRVAAARPDLSPVEVSDLEDELTDRLDELGLPDAMDLAATLAASGLDSSWVDRVVEATGPEAAPPAIRWLANTFETDALMNEIEEATSRISHLVAAVKQYAYMDSASTQEVDVHVGLDSTVVILGHKLAGIEVRREYDRTLPKIPAHPAELNQVWTNLIDNAADAMHGSGVLTLRTRTDGDALLVEVADTGDGIPDEVLPRIFEAFYTTKDPGSGSGLGLENARRIVVKRHHGTIDASSSPAGTTFSVRLPMHQQLR